jgi:hypothetical protein
MEFTRTPEKNALPGHETPTPPPTTTIPTTTATTEALPQGRVPAKLVGS